MCGIIAILARPSEREVPSEDELLTLLRQAVQSSDLAAASEHLAAVDRMLHGTPGLRALVGRVALVEEMSTHLDRLDARAAARERELEVESVLSPDALEL